MAYLLVKANGDLPSLYFMAIDMPTGAKKPAFRKVQQNKAVEHVSR
jgi:hypothetical protein